MSSLVLLPAISVLAWTVLFLRPGSDREGPGVWTRAFLFSSVLNGAVVSVSSEVFSGLQLLARGPVIFLWTLSCGVAIALGLRRGAWAAAVDHLRSLARSLRDEKPIEMFAAIVFVASAALLLVIAAVSPPNTVDAMLYHEPRVMHWIQDRSLMPYATAYAHQIYNPIWSEVVGLHLRLLAGVESSANLLQWACWLGSIALAAGLAHQLGASTRGARLSAAYFASLPLAILEATGAKNDLAAGFWLLALASFTLLAWSRRLRGVEWLATGLAAGLGVLTKGTFLPFAVPFLAVLLVAGLRRNPAAGRIQAGFGVLAGLALNAPHWGRNLLVYGSPVGPAASVGENIGLTLDPIAVALQLIANVAQNLVVPWAAFRQAVEATVSGLYQFFGRDPAVFQLAELWNHEDQAGNPLHILLGLLALAILLRLRRPSPNRLALLTLVSLIVFSATVKFHPTGVRYQVPFFGLCAVAVGLAASEVDRPSLKRWGVLVLLLAGLPWIVLNRTRPLVSWRPRTSVDSVFVASRWDLMFANWRERRDPTRASVEAVLASTCREVGLRIDSHDWEYPFWSGLGAPESGIHLAVLNPVVELRLFQDADFRPCAILCTICGGRERLHGLARVESWDDIVLYEGGTYVTDPDG